MRPKLSHVTLAAAFMLGGCASFSPDGGLSEVSAITAPALGSEAIAVRTPEEAAMAEERVKALLKRPLTPASAVQIALLNNRTLQAAYNALGLSEAAFVQATLPPNPTLSLSRIAGGGGLEIEGRVVASVLNLATLPVRAEIAQDRWRQAQLQAAQETLRVATDARRAYVRAVAARAMVGFLEQAKSTGTAAAELARRLGETGAMNKLDQARNQVFDAELVAQLATARQRAASERERLTRALGLWGPQGTFILPRALPLLPARPRAVMNIEVEAVARRIDVQMLRIDAALLAKSYGLTNATRFINLLDVAGIAKRTTDGGDTLREHGVEVEIQIPLFDLGEVRVRQAQESYMQAVNRLTARAVNARSEAREAYTAYRSAYDIARLYRRAVLPLRKIIADETLLRYNAMQIDVFALLAEARQRVASTVAALDAERDYFLAEADLFQAVQAGGAPSPSDSPSNPVAAAAESPGGH